MPSVLYNVQTFSWKISLILCNLYLNNSDAFHISTFTNTCFGMNIGCLVHQRTDFGFSDLMKTLLCSKKLEIILCLTFSCMVSVLFVWIGYFRPCSLPWTTQKRSNYSSKVSVALPGNFLSKFMFNFLSPSSSFCVLQLIAWGDNLECRVVTLRRCFCSFWDNFSSVNSGWRHQECNWRCRVWGRGYTWAEYKWNKATWYSVGSVLNRWYDMCSLCELCGRYSERASWGQKSRSSLGYFIRGSGIWS